MTITLTSNKLRYQGGLLMLLVVLGHMNFDNVLLCNPFYAELREAIYKFHMPLFFVISGGTFRLVDKRGGELKLFVFSRNRKFGIAFIGLSLVFALYDIIVSKNDIDLSLIINCLVYPGRNSAGYLWYILVLYILYFITAMNLDKLKWLILIMPFIASIAYRYGGDHLIFLVSYYYIFFYIGWTLYENPIRMKNLYLFLSGILFIALLGYSCSSWLCKFVTGIVGVFPFLALPLDRFNFLRYLGENSWPIYLWNVPAIFVVNMALQKYVCHPVIVLLNTVLSIVLIIVVKFLYETTYSKTRVR